jgi:NTE family protein
MRLWGLLAAVGAAALLACAEQPASLASPGEEPFLAGPAEPARLAVVLSSGALRGLAHVGVLRALEAEGIRPELIVGSSVGALIGAINASGVSAGDIGRSVAADDFDFGSDWLTSAVGRPRLSVYQFTQQNLKHQRIERFPVRFAAVVTDLRQGCMAVFNAGGAALAVQASTGLPGVFAATTLAGRDYADGALSSPLPVRVARELGAQRVIAIDVIYPPVESRLDGMVDRLFQIGLVLTHSLATQEAQEADLVIRPSFPAELSVNMNNRAALMALGDEAVRRALPEIRKLLRHPAPAPEPRRADARRCAGLITASR